MSFRVFTKPPRRRRADADTQFMVDVENQNSLDQNFVLLLKPTAPADSQPMPDTLAWMCGVVPGKTATVTSIGRFGWCPELAVCLGRMTGTSLSNFQTVSPVPLGASQYNTLSVGFSGSVRSGALTPGALTTTPPHTTISLTGTPTIPTIVAQNDTNVDYRASVSVGQQPGPARFNPAIAFRMQPNCHYTCATTFSYHIVTAALETNPASIISGPQAGSAFTIPLDGNNYAGLRYGEDNLFQVAGAPVHQTGSSL